MRIYVKIVCVMLAVFLVIGTAAIPSYAAETEVEEGSVLTSNSSSMGYFNSEEAETAALGKTEDNTESEREQPPKTVEEPTTDEVSPTEETSESEPEEEKPDLPEDDTEEKADEKTSEEPVYNAVPLILQTDYPDVAYSGGSLATSGCTMACVAMVGSYLRGEEVSVVELARLFGKYEASNMQRMEYASIELDLTFAMTESWSKVMKALEEDKVVIVMMGKQSAFTNSQHMIVLTDLTEDGRILVNDPNGNNYHKAELRDGFENGFTEKEILSGFGCAWIYEEFQAPKLIATRYPGVELTEDEQYLLASIIWLEARGESFEGQQAIAEIILNRLVSDDFPDTIRDIIYAADQFSTTKFLDEAEPGQIQYKAIQCALTRENVLPIDVYFFGRYPANKNVWGTIGGHTFCYQW